MSISKISAEILSEIARDVFGTDARIRSARRVGSQKQHGITRVAESTRNVLYLVSLTNVPGRVIFRFSRNGDDVYDREVRNYRLLSDQTGVRVPRVFRVDRRRTVAPTSYMVLEYLDGDHWKYLAHPRNRDTSPTVKEDVLRETGRYYARVHRVKKRAERTDQEVRTVLYMLERLRQAVERGVVDIRPDLIARCREAVRREPTFREEMLSLCLLDTEIQFAKRAGSYALAFVCDAEWVEYRTPEADLVPVLSGFTPPWEVDVPLCNGTSVPAAMRPFFEGYAEEHPLDNERLRYLSAYYQLGQWAYLAYEPAPPEKKAWIKQQKEPLIRELVRIVAARAG